MLWFYIHFLFKFLQHGRYYFDVLCPFEFEWQNKPLDLFSDLFITQEIEKLLSVLFNLLVINKIVNYQN